MSGNADKRLRLWELSRGRCLRTFEGHTDAVLSVAVSGDGRFALSGSADKTLRLWELSTGRCLRTFVGHGLAVNSVAISPDGRLGLSGSRDSTLRVWGLLWDSDCPDPADWDEAARPCLQSFLTRHCACGRRPGTHVGKPEWNDDDFEGLLEDLQYRGFGWLRPEGVRRELEKMTAEWKGPPPLPGRWWVPGFLRR
jgi:WD40 repeat protein